MADPAYSRIDQGIKRGPRKKSGPKPSSPRRANGQLLPKLSNDPEDIRKALKEYSEGATLKQLAEQHNVSSQAIYGWLLGELGGQEHQALVTQALTSRIARGDQMIEDADNPLDLARGRELSRNWRMDLERRRSSLYGQKQEVQHTVVAPTLQITVVSPQHAAPLPAESLPATIDHATQAIDK